MKNISLLLVLLLLEMSCAPGKSGDGNVNDGVGCRIKEVHIPPSGVLHMKSYYVSASYEALGDTLVFGYNDRSHTLDVIDCRADTLGEIHLDKEGDNGVVGRVGGLHVHTPDSIWVYSEAMQAYLVGRDGRIRHKCDLHASLAADEELSVMSHHAICTSRLFYDAGRGTLLYAVVGRHAEASSFKVRELDVHTGRVVRDYPLQASVAASDVSSGYANMNRVNVAIDDSLIVYNYPIESHIYVLDRNSGATRVINADSYYTENRAEKCNSMDYSEWERHQVENPHFFDVMYLPAAQLYVRLHLGGIAYEQGRTLGEALASRPLYASFFDRGFHKLGEIKLPERRYNYFMGWCGMSDGVLIFVDNELDESEFSEDLFFDRIMPEKKEQAVGFLGKEGEQNPVPPRISMFCSRGGCLPWKGGVTCKGKQKNGIMTVAIAIAALKGIEFIV